MITKLVFDPKLWNGKDKGDNSQFWKEAEILELSLTDHKEEIAKVRFLHDNRISHGHFTSVMR